MKIGLLREEKTPKDRRVVLTPNQCKKIIELYPYIEIYVQHSNERCFANHEYIELGIPVVDNLQKCDILLGVKEVPIDQLIANKTYFFFSHTIKKQPYNRLLLKKMIELNIRMIDYEALLDQYNSRLLGFGRYAGIVGGYNALLTYGLKTNRFKIKPAYLCKGITDLEQQIPKIMLKNEKILVTGKGRVGRGVIEMMKKCSIREVNVDDFINKDFQQPVYANLDVLDYNKRIDGFESSKEYFYNFPSQFESSFHKFTSKADIFIAGHYFNEGSPYLLTLDDLKNSSFNIKVIADISCDINGPIISTIRDSKISDPIYGFCRKSFKEVEYSDSNAIAVMAVSNLPCELPKDASYDFGSSMMTKIFPLITSDFNHKILANATICEKGDLTKKFEYLRDYVNS